MLTSGTVGLCDGAPVPWTRAHVTAEEAEALRAETARRSYQVTTLQPSPDGGFSAATFACPAPRIARGRRRVGFGVPTVAELLAGKCPEYPNMAQPT